MASESLEVALGGLEELLNARWRRIWIQDTIRLNRCRFRLVWEKSEKCYEKDLKIGDNNLLDDWLYQGNKVKIEITHNVNPSMFYVHTLPGSLKDSNYAYEDLSITYSTDVISSTSYGYFYMFPWKLQGCDRWLEIYGTHLVLRFDTLGSAMGIDIDWKYLFTRWLGGYGGSIPSFVERPMGVHATSLATVKEYGWPEGFTVWLKTPTTDEERICGEKEVDILLIQYPKLVMKKNGKPVAQIWTQDEASWDLSLCWNVNDTRAGIARHVYRPPYNNELNKHALYVSPSWVTAYIYPLTFPGLRSNTGISVDISKELGIWMVENVSLAEEGSSAEKEVGLGEESSG